MKKEAKENVSAAIVLSKALEKKATPFINKLTTGEKITTPELYNKSAELMKQLKELATEARNQKASIVDPLKEAMSAVDNLFKPFLTQVATIEVEVKSRMGQFLLLQEEKKEKLAKKVEDGDMKVGTFFRKQNELNVSSSSAKVRTLQQLKIVKASSIPRKFLMPDERKIEAALKDGKKVPGCRMEAVKSIAI